MKASRRRPVRLVLTAAVLASSWQVTGIGHDRDPPLRIDHVTPVASRAIGSWFVDETYAADLSLSGPPGDPGQGVDYAQVTARIAQITWLAVPGFVQVL